MSFPDRYSGQPDINVSVGVIIRYICSLCMYVTRWCCPISFSPHTSFHWKYKQQYIHTYIYVHTLDSSSSQTELLVSAEWNDLTEVNIHLDVCVYICMYVQYVQFVCKYMGEFM